MKEQIKKCKKTEREVFEKYANLSEDRLSEKSNKNVYVKNDVVSTVIKRCRGEKKRGEREIDRFRKKLMIPGSEITVSRAQSQIKNRKNICKPKNT